MGGDNQNGLPDLRRPGTPVTLAWLRYVVTICTPNGDSEMPRYFFDVETEEPDKSGVVLENRSVARGEAIKAAGEILRDIDGDFSGREWAMRVREAGSGRVLEIRFSVKDWA